MKASKDATRAARGLFRLTLVDGKLDGDRAKRIVAKLVKEKPRDYFSILHAYLRLVRLEFEKHHAVVESAVDLPEELGKEILDGLKGKFGDDLSSEIRTNPELLGGLRVRVGSDVWDGSVRGRIARLAERL